MLGLSQTRITAPVDGVVSEKLVAPGAFVNQSTSVITLVPPGVNVVANLPEQQLGSVQQGQTVNFTVSAYPGTTFQGVVATISPTVNAQTRTVQVQIQPVTLGLVNDTRAEVTSGLDDGQLVATGSISTLTDGQVVTPQVQAVTARSAP